MRKPEKSSPKTDMYALAVTLVLGALVWTPIGIFPTGRFLPSSSKLNHTIDLMGVYDEENRPDLKFFEVDILNELHKYSERELTAALIKHNCIAKNAMEAKIISVLLSSSTPTCNLATDKNLDLIKRNSGLKTAILTAYSYLNSEQFSCHTRHGEHGISQTYQFIRELMELENLQQTSIENEVKNWVRGYGMFCRASSGGYYHSRINYAKRSGLIANKKEILDSTSPLLSTNNPSYNNEEKLAAILDIDIKHANLKSFAKNQNVINLLKYVQRREDEQSFRKQKNRLILNHNSVFASVFKGDSASAPVKISAARKMIRAIYNDTYKTNKMIPFSFVEVRAFDDGRLNHYWKLMKRHNQAPHAFNLALRNLQQADAELENFLYMRKLY